jgi:hypothetical protein
METFNQLLGCVAYRAPLLSSPGPVQARIASLRGSVKCLLGAATLAAALAAPTWSAQFPDATEGHGAAQTDSEAAARAEWRAIMRHSSPTGTGCFHASYPSIVVERVECETGEPRAEFVRGDRTDDEADVVGDGAGVAGNGPAVVGNGHDYVAHSAGLIMETNIGLSTTGVNAVETVGSKLDQNAVLGAGEYSLQLNTNMNSTTSACAGHSGCTVWQQFIYATDYIKPGTAGLFMRYWLFNWGSSACPSGWTKLGVDCYKNSLVARATDMAISQIDASVLFVATVTAGGNDQISLEQKADYAWITAPDSVLDISSVWTDAEFNVFGDGSGTEAYFNTGSVIGISIEVLDGAPEALTCVGSGGTTMGSNNLTLGACSAQEIGFGVGEFGFTESN